MGSISKNSSNSFSRRKKTFVGFGGDKKETKPGGEHRIISKAVGKVVFFY